MSEYLFRVSINYQYPYTGKKTAVYAVAETKEKVLEYVQHHLAQGCTVKSACVLGERLGMNMYHGK